MATERKEKEKPSAEQQKKETAATEEKKSRNLTIYVLLIMAALLIIGIVSLSGSLSNVSFSSFKQNFNSAQRVAFVVYYNNASTYGLETICATDTVEVLSSKRSPSTIDFFTLQSNNCTYIPNGLGHIGNVLTTNSSSCLSTAASEPSIYLNYSNTNSTVITPYHLKIYGNSGYMRSCPLAVDLT